MPVCAVCQKDYKLRPEQMLGQGFFSKKGWEPLCPRCFEKATQKKGSTSRKERDGTSLSSQAKYPISDLAD